jgi:two-component system chemotaxis response regulator CheB
MVTRVLVVDDSGFFRRRIVDILETDARIEVVGTADNGKAAIDQVAKLKPDVVTMDIEMPVIDGITTVQCITSILPTPTLMFSSLTLNGAQATLDALEAGAVDFLPRRFEDIVKDRDQAKLLLHRRLHAVARKKSAAKPETALSAPLKATSISTGVEDKPFQVVVIASSTGGPLALARVLTSLPADFPYPVLVVQHMPATFTPSFASRLDQQCALNVKEAAEGDEVKSGQVLVAPGGRQMTLKQSGGEVKVNINDGDPGLRYRPCADTTFESVARIYGVKTLALVLTGMGADGCEGARKLKQLGATVWSQDEASSVIYGMPMAVAEAGLSDRVLSLSDIGPSLLLVAGG